MVLGKAHFSADGPCTADLQRRCFLFVLFCPFKIKQPTSFFFFFFCGFGFLQKRRVPTKRQHNYVGFLEPPIKQEIPTPRKTPPRGPGVVHLQRLGHAAPGEALNSFSRAAPPEVFWAFRTFGALVVQPAIWFLRKLRSSV